MMWFDPESVFLANFPCVLLKHCTIIIYNIFSIPTVTWEFINTLGMNTVSFAEFPLESAAACKTVYGFCVRLPSISFGVEKLCCSYHPFLLLRSGLLVLS